MKHCCEFPDLANPPSGFAFGPDPRPDLIGKGTYTTNTIVEVITTTGDPIYKEFNNISGDYDIDPVDNALINGDYQIIGYTTITEYRYTTTYITLLHNY